MTAPTPAPPGPLGARTWEAPDDAGSPASARSQVATAAVVSAALLLVTGLAGAPAWGVAAVLALVAGIAAGLAAPPIPFLRRMSGLVLAVVVVGAGLVVLTLSWSVAGVELPPALVPLLGLVALGLDWRRADRLRPLVTASGAPVLLVALSGEPWAIGAAVAWLGAAFGTYTLLEGDRRAALPRVQPEARAEARGARPDDLLTTLLVAAAVGLLAALVLSVPACQRRIDPPNPPVPDLPTSGSAGSGQVGEGTGSGGRYVPDPDGRFLIPDDGSGGSSGSPRVPDPEGVPSGLEPGSPQTLRTDDGGEITYERRSDGDVSVTVRDPDGTVSEWRLRERSDGLVEIDRLRPDGSVAERWWYDPDGQAAQGAPGAGADQVPPPEPEPERERRPPDLATIGRVLGILALLGLLAWLAWRWWRRRHPDAAAPPVGGAPPWALALVARLEEEGRARGRPRAADESVVRYGQRLTEGPLPDGRLPMVAEVVSDALFSGSDPGPTVATWARSTLDEIVAAHPAPARRDARRRDAAVG